MANIIIPPHHQSAPKTTYGAGHHIILPHQEQTDEEKERARALASTHRGDDEFIEPEQIAALPYADKSSAAMLEEAQRQFEKTYNSPKVKEQRWDGQERYQGRENEEMRLVRIMHPNSFLRKLNDAGVKAPQFVPDGCDDPLVTGRVWINNFSRVGRIGVNAWVWDPAQEKKVPTTVTTLQYPYGPEWSLMHFDRFDIPTTERYRGWRTALLTLIIKGIITEEEAERAFGVAEGPAAMFYREQIYYFRNRRRPDGTRQ